MSLFVVVVVIWRRKGPNWKQQQPRSTWHISSPVARTKLVIVDLDIDVVVIVVAVGGGVAVVEVVLVVAVVVDVIVCRKTGFVRYNVHRRCLTYLEWHSRRYVSSCLTPAYRSLSSCRRRR